MIKGKNVQDENDWFILLFIVLPAFFDICRYRKEVLRSIFDFI